MDSEITRPYNCSWHASEGKTHRILNLDHHDSSRWTLEPSQRGLKPKIREIWRPWAYFRPADWVRGMMVVLCRQRVNVQPWTEMCPSLIYSYLPQVTAQTESCSGFPRKTNSFRKITELFDILKNVFLIFFNFYPCIL